MKNHGLVILILTVFSHASCGQDSAPPRRLEILDSPGQGNAPVGQPAELGASPNALTLQSELEALRADLDSFHSTSQDLSRSARELESKNDKLAIEQRQKVVDLLTKLMAKSAKRPARETVAATAPKEATEPKLETPEAEDPKTQYPPLQLNLPPSFENASDPFALGKILFRNGDFDRAEQAFKKVVTDNENRDMIKYLIATCKARRNLPEEAVKAYRDIIATGKDPVIRNFAQFQLDGIRWRQDVEKGLETLRQQREQQANRPSSEQTESSRR